MSSNTCARRLPSCPGSLHTPENETPRRTEITRESTPTCRLLAVRVSKLGVPCLCFFSCRDLGVIAAAQLTSSEPAMVVSEREGRKRERKNNGRKHGSGNEQRRVRRVTTRANHGQPIPIRAPDNADATKRSYYAIRAASQSRFNVAPRSRQNNDTPPFHTEQCPERERTTALRHVFPSHSRFRVLPAFLTLLIESRRPQKGLPGRRWPGAVVLALHKRGPHSLRTRRLFPIIWVEAARDVTPDVTGLEPKANAAEAAVSDAEGFSWREKRAKPCVPAEK